MKSRKPKQSEGKADADGVFSAFAKFVEETRRQRNRTQVELAKALNKHQSYVTRLEAGQVEPSLEIVDELSSYLSVPRERLAALVLQDKYKLTPAATAPLHWRPKNINELIRWEMGSDHDEIWIVTQEFIDLNFSNVQKQVIEFLKRGKILFFTGVDQKPEFELYRQKIEYSGPNFNAVCLEKSRLGLLAASFIIANPMAYGQSVTANFQKATSFFATNRMCQKSGWRWARMS
jgi:transcriptional regulator with XRE-family HTH domain